ncbi:ribonuclease HIII [Bacillus lacus]|uniref:Ribonuclease HIII n=1 Tax=Metabacillus lacus TaxID=1983721 RepID=A0A7X2LZK4_9BACI|nr:ribonuclease HIII [Metabacillus lacus]MRX71794.1 ribonuclease HIII [Metabacillus lacus]
MSHAVLTVSGDTMIKMKKAYQKHLSPKTPPGGVFAAKLTGCTITAYQSGKVLFQGVSAAEEAGKWGSPAPGKPVQKVSKAPSIFSPPPNIAELSIVGSDEVGTGDFFGPMTVTAAYVKKEQLGLLKEIGVKDSKNLNDDQISAIAKDLLHIIPYSLLILHNPKYNELQKQGMSQGKMKALLHNKAISNLLEKIKPDVPEGILIDQFAEPGVYYNYLKSAPPFKSQTYFSTKAEGIHLAVAAASIISRYSFVKEFEKLSKSAGMILPKGAGPKVDQAAAKLIKKHGKDYLAAFTKEHFANTQKARKLAGL